MSPLSLKLTKLTIVFGFYGRPNDRCYLGKEAVWRVEPSRTHKHVRIDEGEEVAARFVSTKNTSIDQSQIAFYVKGGRSSHLSG